MQFGTWTDIEIEKTILKLDRYKQLKLNLIDESLKIHEVVYQRYLNVFETKKNFFRIFFNIKALSKEEFFNKTCYYFINTKMAKVYIWRDNSELKKYEVQLSELELKVVCAIEWIYRNSFNETCDKLRNLLTYCVGGDITSDDVYVLCDLDIEIKKLETLLNEIK